MNLGERNRAKVAGEGRYFTGKPCSRGHVAQRHTSNGLCVECRRDNVRKHRQTPEGLQKSRDARRAWYAKHGAKPEERAKAVRRAVKWMRANKDRPELREVVAERARRWSKTQRGKLMRKQNAQRVEVRLKLRLRQRAREALRGQRKPDSVSRSVGCTFEHLKTHISAQFAPGMSWENYGEWELDHKRPLSSFYLTKLDQFKAANHFTNLQPLWKRDNRSKGAKWGASA